MEAYQREFIEFALSLGVLRFGSFKLKSGRTSPYFFNAGLFQTSGALSRLADFYAAAIKATGIEYDGLFGPAYKGIPLVSVTSIALYRSFGLDIPYSFNRKEAKDHGEGGTIVGAPLKGKILIIDDVITAGTAVREAFDILKNNNASPAGVVVALDRQEITGGVDIPEGPRPRSAIQEVEATYGVPVVSIIKLEHLLTFLREKPEMEENLKAVELYRATYGI